VNERVFRSGDRNFNTYTVRLKWGDDLWVDYEVFADLWSISDEKQQWNRKGTTQRPDPVDSLDEAQPTVSGYVKWDGCQHIDWHEGHICERYQMDGIFKAIGDARTEAFKAMQRDEDAR
jgi:hypothetical protein